MKKSVIIMSLLFALIGIINLKACADNQEMVTIKIPADEINNIDIKYQKQEESAASKFVKATKKATKKTVDSTKDLTEKTVDATKKATGKTVNATKKATDKTVKSTKKFTDKTVDVTKKATDKTVKATKKATESTKEFTEKTIDETKDFIDNINPNKPVTVEGLEKKSAIKTLKNERNELKAAYNSRIKDIDAKIKLTEISTDMTQAQRQNRIYNLNKEKQEIINARESAIEKYNSQIKKLRETSQK